MWSNYRLKLTAAPYLVAPPMPRRSVSHIEVRESRRLYSRERG